MISDALQELVDHTLETLEAAGCEMREKGAERWRGQCPLCEQRDLTLNVDLEQNRLWLNCAHATCDWQAIQEALGLTKSDLRLDQAAVVELVRRPFNTIKSEPVRFLVPGLVPTGGVTLLVKDPKAGGSTWTALIAAGVTQGSYGDAAPVAFVNAEDSAAAVTRPRLQAAGAKLERVFGLTVNAGEYERPLTLPTDVPMLEAFLHETGARLLVLDPLMAFLAEQVDSNRDHAVRRALAGLALMAERHDVAVLCAAHLNKDEAKRVLYRVGGTIALVALARSVLLLTHDPNDPDGNYGDQRLLAHIGSNWARLAATQRYRIEEVVLDGDETIATTKLVYEGESDLEAEELVGRQSAPNKSERAARAILDELENGGRPSRDVKAAVTKAVSCGLDTVDRAATDLRVHGVLGSSGSGPATTWYLLSKPPDIGLLESGGGSKPASAVENQPPPDLETRGSGGCDQAVLNGGNDRESAEAELARRERRR